MSELRRLFVIFREVLNLSGIYVARESGMYIIEVIVNTIYKSDSLSRSTASTMIEDFEHSNVQPISLSSALTRYLD